MKETARKVGKERIQNDISKNIVKIYNNGEFSQVKLKDIKNQYERFYIVMDTFIHSSCKPLCSKCRQSSAKKEYNFFLGECICCNLSFKIEYLTSL